MERAHVTRETEIEVLELKTRNGYRSWEVKTGILPEVQKQHSPVQSLDFRFLVFIIQRINLLF